MKIERHTIDDAYLKDMPERFERTIKELPDYVDGARENPKNLGLLIGRAHAAAGFGCVVDSQSPEIPAALDLAAEASSALFAAVVASPSHPVVVRLGKAEPVTYTSPSDESEVHVGRWIDAFYFNVLCSDMDGLKSLSQVPLDVLRRSSTKGPEYGFLYVESLRAFVNRDPSVVEKILAAIKATDPKRPDITDADWDLYLHVPQLEVLIYMVTKDAKFTESLTKAVELHKKYWSKTKDRRRDYRGFVSIELTALAALGKERNLPIEAESPYLPLHLLEH